MEQVLSIEKMGKDEAREVVELLKISLGENLILKSVDYWNWKHLYNPFGGSVVLLAKEADRITGVRAFMRWKWQYQYASVPSVRAVDTATHPDHQGKGIFSALTMEAVKNCIESGDSFVFNTPNKKSRPGYLKMGWETAGKLPLSVKAGVLKPVFYDDDICEEVYKHFSADVSVKSLGANWQLHDNLPVYHTPLNTEYLQWRYVDCPVARYGAIVDKGCFGIFFRIKKIREFCELRICDIWIQEPFVTAKLFIAAFKEIIKAVKPLLITMGPSVHLPGEIERQLKFLITINAGPVTTVRKLAMKELSDLVGFKNWSPSLGSLELF